MAKKTPAPFTKAAKRTATAATTPGKPNRGLPKPKTSGKAAAATKQRQAELPWEERPPTPRWDDPEFEGFEEREMAKDLADSICELNLAKKQLEEQISEKTTLLNAYMSGYKDDESWSMASDDWTASYVKPKDKRTLIVEKLIEQGVKEAVIEKATQVTPVTPYVQVRAKKQKEE